MSFLQAVFVIAGELKITAADGANFAEFIALELYPGALRGVAGKLHEDPVFMIDQEELLRFERNYPYREKRVTDTQLK